MVSSTHISLKRKIVSELKFLNTDMLSNDRKRLSTSLNRNSAPYLHHDHRNHRNIENTPYRNLFFSVWIKSVVL